MNRADEQGRKKVKPAPKQLKRLPIYLPGFIWMTLVLGSLYWNYHLVDRHALELSKDTARSFFNQITITRLWNSQHGGVYVPVTGETRPNPYLDDPERDVTTLSGMKLTRINPAYMTRQISELAEIERGVKFHITSLKPIRPANQAEKWEVPALQMFEEGITEWSGWATKDSEKVFRYMAPLFVEQACLKCHEKQGYSLGEIRGGISVTIPAGKMLSTAYRQKSNMMLLHLAFLVLGTSGITFFQTRSQQQSSALESANMELRKLSQAVEQSPASIVITDKEGKIQYVNLKFCQVTGYTFEEAIGQNPRILKSDEKPAEDYREMWETISKGEEWRGEFHNKRKNGELYWEFASISPIFNEQGEITNYLAVKEDITRRKEAEERQEELNRELADVNQELNDFAYVVSHDLKAPLRAIGSLANWIASDYGDKLDEKGREQIKLLLGRVKRMDGLIDGILKYSRIGRVHEEKEEKDLNEIVREAIEMVAPPAHITIEIEHKLPVVKCEKTRMEQVFQNLISNAVKYMDKPKGHITIGCTPENNHWKFHVSDNGPGIESKYFEKLFQLFQTLSPRDQVESTGVGLALVKKIVELYGGEIWVESEVGVGSRFFFTFPKEAENHGS